MQFFSRVHIVLHHQNPVQVSYERARQPQISLPLLLISRAGLNVVKNKSKLRLLNREMLMNRRYFSSSIDEPETLFENQKDKRSVLEILENELPHRKTELAARLRGRVAGRLTQLGIRTSSSTLEQESVQFDGTPVNGIDQHQSDAPGMRKKSADNSGPTSATLRGRVKNQAPRALPGETNTPESVLSAWTALEVLSPPGFRRPEDLASGERTRVARLAGDRLPWERGEKSRPKQRLYYQVVLGSIRMAPPVELLIEHYGDTRIEKQRVDKNAALAVVILDQQGRLAASPAVTVSSFGWGVVTALHGQLEDLAQ